MVCRRKDHLEEFDDLLLLLSFSIIDDMSFGSFEVGLVAAGGGGWTFGWSLLPFTTAPSKILK